MIKFTNVDKFYSDGNKSLDNVNLGIKQGEFVFLVGHSGAGKSTLLKLLTREEKISSGRLSVLGEDITKIKASKVHNYRRNLGIVFQDFRLLNEKTVYENVELALRVVGTNAKEIRPRVMEVLKRVGIAEKHSKYPHELSGGQQQRVAIARAIVNRPKVLIADEPTGNLDPETSKEIISLLERINEKQNTTVLVVTHDSKIVQEHKKRTILIEDGCVNADTSLGGYEI